MPRSQLDPLMAAFARAPQPASIQEMRDNLEAFIAFTNAGAPAVARHERAIPVAAGSTPSVDVLLPRGVGPFPVLVYFHGGGWCIGSPRSHEKLTSELANQAGVIVVSVDYRLAPEHPFPIPFDDCLLAIEWTVKNISRYGGDPTRLAIGGDSAGGNLTAATVAALRRSGSPIRPQAVALLYGSFDIEETADEYRKYAPAGDPILSETMTRLMVEGYLSSRPDLRDPRLSPMHAELSGFPPAFLTVGSADPLVGQSLRFADRLAAAQVEVEMVVYAGMPHAFMQLSLVDECGQAIAATARFLRERLGANHR